MTSIQSPPSRLSAYFNPILDMTSSFQFPITWKEKEKKGISSYVTEKLLTFLNTLKEVYCSINTSIGPGLLSLEVVLSSLTVPCSSKEAGLSTSTLSTLVYLSRMPENGHQPEGSQLIVLLLL